MKMWATAIGFGILALLTIGSELITWYERGLPGNLSDLFL